jgi:hypothetical protein
MSDNHYLVLKEESIQRLKRSVTSKPEILDQEFDQICDNLHLGFVSTNYTVRSEPALLMPKGMRQEENQDSENCKLVLEILPNLTPAQATDERLWVTLCLSRFPEYVRARWPFRSADGKNLATHVGNHWFANGVRGRMRDNAISRLWWMGHTARRIPNMSLEQVFEILFDNSDYRSSLLERNSSANSINVLVAVLRVSEGAYKAGIPFKRASFRQFMTRIDTLGGRSNLASLSVESLEKIFTPIYQECYSESDAVAK